MDDFLNENIRANLQKKLINHWGWHYRHVNREHLHNTKPNFSEIIEIDNHLQRLLPDIFKDYKYQNHWAIMNNQNTEGIIHADSADLVLSMWLTPDKYNLNPESGGLILYDVRKPSRYVENFDAKDFLARNTKGDKVKIPYKCNRATLFNPLTIHSSDKVNFSNDRGSNHRINLSISYVNN